MTTLSMRRPRVITAILVGLAFLMLVGLGVWQIQRMYWKVNLIHQMETRLSAPPVALPHGGIDPEEWRYRRVELDGTFRHDQEIHLYAMDKWGQPGFLIFTPLQRPDGSFVFVERGWVPNDHKDPVTRAAGQVTGPVHIVGIVHLPWPRHMFVGRNLPEQNVWFFGDIDAMARHAGIRDYAPVFVDADATPNPGGLPIGGQTRVNLPNNHLQYALTWFGLALVLLVMFIYGHMRPAEATRSELPPRNRGDLPDA